MSYPRNAATPPRVAVGPVVQISDGAVQTSGVSIRVVPQGGSAAAGLGTTSYEDGVVLYAPTQAETNYEAFAIIAYKSGCIPASTTVVTSASATAGYGGVDWSKITAATTTVNLSGTTIATSQAIASVSGAVGSVTGNVGGNVSGSVGSISGVTFPTNFASLAITVGGAVTAGTVSDKTGYSLASGGLASVTAWTVNITGSLSGSVGSVTGAVGSVTAGVTVTTNNDKTGYSLTQAFPANFASLGINASGHISRVVLVDTTTVNSDMRGTDGAALASIWTSTVAGRIDAAISTRSSHSAADVWSVATRTLTAFSFSVTVGTNNDKTGYSLATAPLDASGTAAAVWGAALASYTGNTTFGGRIMRTDQASSGNSAKVTSAGHVAADIHDLQPAVIASTHFAAGAIDANALAADAAAEVATAVRAELAVELARIDVTVGSRLATIGYTAPPTATTIADTTLGRSVSNVEATASEHSICTLVLAALESSVIGATWTIKRTDGTTTHVTKTVTTDASAEPITGVT